MCPQETHCPPSAGLEEGYCTTGMVSGDGIWIPKEMQSKGITNFHPISLLNVKRKIFFEVLAHRLTNFQLSNHYINTSVQKAGITWLPGYLGHSQMIWNLILSAKRDKTKHVIWLDLANAYSSVPHHLIQMAPDFFNFPSKVGEIIMKYFNSAFMEFTIKDYTTKWQALEISIMMGCDFPTSFHSGHGTHITRCSKYVERINDKNIWLFLLLELLWMTSPFSSCPKSLPMSYYKGTKIFSHRREWRQRQRKVEAHH